MMENQNISERSRPIRESIDGSIAENRASEKICLLFGITFVITGLLAAGFGLRTGNFVVFAAGIITVALLIPAMLARQRFRRDSATTKQLAASMEAIDSLDEKVEAVRSFLENEQNPQEKSPDLSGSLGARAKRLLEDLETVAAKLRASPRRASDSLSRRVGWCLGSVLLLVLVWVLFRLPNPSPTQRGILQFFMSLLAGITTGLFTGSIRLKGKILGIPVAAAGGLAIFVLMQFVVDPFSFQEKLGDVAPHLIKVDTRVAEAQAALKRLGFKVGEHPGVLDSVTAESIHIFQETSGLAPERFLGPRTLAMLKFVPPPTPITNLGPSRVRGVLTDRRGNPVSGMIVSIRRGPETRSDAGGQFVLNDTPMGDQLLVVKSPSEKGEWIQNITIQTNGTTDAKIVYDSRSSRLGLLSIVAPVDGSEVSLRYNGLDYLGQVHGRCDGLPDILGRFDVWVLIRSELDGSFWVQHPPAIVDPTANNWRADVRFGNRQTPPKDGGRWHLVVVAAPIDSNLKDVMNTPRLSLLPQPYISGNVVTVTTKTKR